MLIDSDVYRSLARLHTSYNEMLAASIRSLDELTSAEIALESDWQHALEPALRDLYWKPLAGGLASAPERPEELRKWIEDGLSTALATVALLSLLRRFIRRGVNIGGYLAFDILDIDGLFGLNDPVYVALIDEHTDMLVTAGSDMSLIDTTVEHLAVGIPAAKASDKPLLAIAEMIAGWALYRSTTIAITEQTRAIANGMNWTYKENGVERQKFRTRADDRVCFICSPLDGHVMAVSNIPSELTIPKHPRCRCYYEAVTTGWHRPTSIWRG